MTWDIASKIFVAVAALIGVVWQVQRTHGGRWKAINEQLNAYSLLPEGELKDTLFTHVGVAIRQQLTTEQEMKRDPNGIALGIIFLGTALGMFYMAFSGGWWWLSIVPGAFFLLFGAVGLYQDAIPRRRDERGNPIRE